MADLGVVFKLVSVVEFEFFYFGRNEMSYYIINKGVKTKLWMEGHTYYHFFWENTGCEGIRCWQKRENLNKKRVRQIGDSVHDFFNSGDTLLLTMGFVKYYGNRRNSWIIFRCYFPSSWRRAANPRLIRSEFKKVKFFELGKLLIRKHSIYIISLCMLMLAFVLCNIDRVLIYR